MCNLRPIRQGLHCGRDLMDGVRKVLSRRTLVGIGRGNDSGGLRLRERGSREEKSGGREKAAENGAANVHPAPQAEGLSCLSRTLDAAAPEMDAKKLTHTGFQRCLLFLPLFRRVYQDRLKCVYHGIAWRKEGSMLIRSLKSLVLLSLLVTFSASAFAASHHHHKHHHAVSAKA
jgi:hypothetical protein